MQSGDCINGKQEGEKWLKILKLYRKDSRNFAQIN